MAAQHCEYTKCHWLVPLKVVNYYTNFTSVFNKTPRHIIRQFWTWEFQTQSHWTNVKMSAKLLLSGGSEGGHYIAFCGFRTLPPFLVYGPFLTPLQFLVMPPTVLSNSDSPAFFYKDLVITLGLSG